jgi:prepilin-type N-terminal cleavage/methylation domain-containing protein
MIQALPHRAKSGYSLLEMMIVLAIISLSVVMVMPRMGAALDQVVVHTLQFEMQRQVSTLRRRAYLEQTDLWLTEQALPAAQTLDEIAPPQAAIPEPVGPQKQWVAITLPKTWKAAYASPIRFKSSGQCTVSDIEVSSLGKRSIRMSLNEDCQLIRTYSPRPAA